MSSGTPHHKAARIAGERLKDMHSFDYLKLLNEARAEFGIPPMRSPNKWENGGGRPRTRCPIRGHSMDCVCDVK